MSPRLLAFALIAGLLGPAGCKEPTGPERPIDGERLFAQNCARCHGNDGRGAVDAPSNTRDLTAAGYMSTLTDERIKATIRMGKPPNMPAFGNRFAEPSLKVLVAYVRHLAEAAPPAGPAKASAGKSTATAPTGAGAGSAAPTGAGGGAGSVAPTSDGATEAEGAAGSMGQGAVGSAKIEGAAGSTKGGAAGAKADAPPGSP